MSRTTVVIDADACVPGALRDALGIVSVPPDAPLLVDDETVPRLSLEAGPPEAEPSSCTTRKRWAR